MEEEGSSTPWLDVPEWDYTDFRHGAFKHADPRTTVQLPAFVLVLDMNMMGHGYIRQIWWDERGTKFQNIVGESHTLCGVQVASLKAGDEFVDSRTGSWYVVHERSTKCVKILEPIKK